MVATFPRRCIVCHEPKEADAFVSFTRQGITKYRQTCKGCWTPQPRPRPVEVIPDLIAIGQLLDTYQIGNSDASLPDRVKMALRQRKSYFYRIASISQENAQLRAQIKGLRMAAMETRQPRKGIEIRDDGYEGEGK